MLFHISKGKATYRKKLKDALNSLRVKGVVTITKLTISQITNTFVQRKHSASGVDWPLHAHAVTFSQLRQGSFPRREPVEVKSCLCLIYTCHCLL